MAQLHLWDTTEGNSNLLISVIDQNTDLSVQCNEIIIMQPNNDMNSSNKQNIKQATRPIKVKLQQLPSSNYTDISKSLYNHTHSSMRSR